MDSKGLSALLLYDSASSRQRANIFATAHIVSPPKIALPRFRALKGYIRIPLTLPRRPGAANEPSRAMRASAYFLALKAGVITCDGETSETELHRSYRV